jgi:hypothetical protein
MTAEYQHIANYDGVKRYIDEATIPPDGGNRDFQQWLEYDAAGGVTDPAPIPPEPVVVPDPNQRLDDGVTAAVDTYSQYTPAQLAGGAGGMSNEERLLRLEETMQAMVTAHGLSSEMARG